MTDDKPQPPKLERPAPQGGEIPMIREMPDRKTLTDFLAGLSGSVTVIFNLDAGKFERIRPGDECE